MNLSTPSPMVSIGLPTRNSMRFLPQRIASIKAQVLTDWEVVAVDGDSTDGTWEYLEGWAQEDKRVRCERQRPQGIYHAFNRCVEASRGQYIYIATADDTMQPACLSELARALELHPDCGIAHCSLTFINELDQPIRGEGDWENWSTTRYYGKVLAQPHVRARAHDTVVALMLGSSVYYSITQLLLRRSLFQETGMFREDLSSFADLDWQMRASLMTKTIHLPEYLATWRRHPQQASQIDTHRRGVAKGIFVEIAEAAIKFSKTVASPEGNGLPHRLSCYFRKERANLRLEQLVQWLSTRELADAIAPGFFDFFHEMMSRLLGFWISGSCRGVQDVSVELQKLNIRPPELLTHV